MLECNEDIAITLPKGQEVLIKYAEDSAGLNSSDTPSSAADYISFSTDGGLTWSAWKLYAGSSSGSSSGTGLLFDIYGVHENGTSTGSWAAFTNGAYTLQYAAPIDTIDNAGESFEIEALFRFKNISSSKVRKIALQISDGVSTIVADYSVLTTGSSITFDYKINCKLTFNALPATSYYTSQATGVGIPSTISDTELNTNNLMSASKVITILPVGDNVTNPGGASDLITCLYLNIHKA